MQDYHEPRYHGKADPNYPAYSEGYENTKGGYEATWCAPAPLRPCGNPLCAQESEALYCSTYCFQAIEGTYDDEDEDEDTLAGESAAPLTDADIETLLALFRTLDPAWREYLALSLTGPEYYCVTQALCAEAQQDETTDPRPDWQIVADPRTYEGTYGRELVRGR